MKLLRVSFFQTTYYNLRPDIASDYHDRMDSACNGGETDFNRDYHLYKVTHHMLESDV